MYGCAWRCRWSSRSPHARQVNLRWELDGEAIRETRTIEITAHSGGFRIWDAWRPESGRIEPGHYHVILETPARRVFGTATIVVNPL